MKVANSDGLGVDEPVLDEACEGEAYCRIPDEAGARFSTVSLGSCSPPTDEREGEENALD